VSSGVYGWKREGSPSWALSFSFVPHTPSFLVERGPALLVQLNVLSKRKKCSMSPCACPVSTLPVCLSSVQCAACAACFSFPYIHKERERKMTLPLYFSTFIFPSAYLFFLCPLLFPIPIPSFSPNSSSTSHTIPLPTLTPPLLIYSSFYFYLFSLTHSFSFAFITIPIVLLPSFHSTLEPLPF
jgi:hypothetical protein